MVLPWQITWMLLMPSLLDSCIFWKYNYTWISMHVFLSVCESSCVWSGLFGHGYMHVAYLRYWIGVNYLFGILIMQVLSFKLNVGHFPHLADLVTRINYNYFYMSDSGNLVTGPGSETVTSKLGKAFPVWMDWYWLD